jgi:hypothetical protein
MIDLIARTATAIDYGASAQDIHDNLITHMSESDAYLTYIAGKLLSASRLEMNPIPKPKIRRIG